MVAQELVRMWQTRCTCDNWATWRREGKRGRTDWRESGVQTTVLTLGREIACGKRILRLWVHGRAQWRWHQQQRRLSLAIEHDDGGGSGWALLSTWHAEGSSMTAAVEPCVSTQQWGYQQRRHQQWQWWLHVPLYVTTRGRFEHGSNGSFNGNSSGWMLLFVWLAEEELSTATTA